MSIYDGMENSPKIRDASEIVHPTTVSGLRGNSLDGETIFSEINRECTIVRRLVIEFERIDDVDSDANNEFQCEYAS